MNKLQDHQFMNKNICDYDIFYKLLLAQQSEMIKEAFKKNKEKQKQNQLKYNAMINRPFAKYDFVLWKPKDDSINKLISNEFYGWIIKDIQSDNTYTIMNAMNKDVIWENVQKGHLTHWHAPIWCNIRDQLDGLMLRMTDLSDRRKAILKNLNAN